MNDTYTYATVYGNVNEYAYDGEQE